MTFTIDIPTTDEILDETIVVIETCNLSEEPIAIYPKDSFVICDYPTRTLREAIEYYNTADFKVRQLYLKSLPILVDWYLDEIKYPHKEEILKLFRRRRNDCVH